jgi:cyclophilin family peptidyl-prolyl cis-trans isomerase
MQSEMSTGPKMIVTTTTTNGRACKARAGTRLLAWAMTGGLMLAFAGQALATPTVTNPFPDTVVRRNAPVQNYNLGARFNDPGVFVYRFNFAGTSLPSVVLAPVDVAMFASAKPITVTNFQNYVNQGRYINTIIHRSAYYSFNPLVPFVLQGGGYARPTLNNASPSIIPTFPSIQNEPGISNRRGTIAMAKVGGQPNSATGQWFFNMNDRNATDPTGALLDTQNGGFTVFGRVVNGLATLDQIANTITSYQAGGFFGDTNLNELPLVNPILNPNVVVRPEDYVAISSIVTLPGGGPLTYSATSSNTNVVQVAVNASTLTLTYVANASGSSEITVRAESTDGTFITDKFVAHVRCNPADIADDQGSILPSPVGNSGVNEGDFNAFFSSSGFFFQSGLGISAVGQSCDIADDQGNPRQLNVPNVPNNGVNEGDFNLFFNNLFAPCA